MERNKRLAKLSSAAQLEEELERLRALGSCETASPAHTLFVERIADRLASMELQVRRDTYRFDRWSLPETSRCALTIHRSDGRAQTVPIASAYPYSGRTGPLGVTGQLQFVRCGKWQWRRAAGKIAVVEVPHLTIPVNVLVDDVGHIPADATGFPERYEHAVLSSLMCGPNLSAAKAAGALGVVAVWRGLTSERAADQYVPFIFPYFGIPAVWVAGDAGAQLLDDARQGAHATLTLDAIVSPDAATDTLWAVVEGENTNESILIATHTDGCNAVEENGAIGVLELARMFAGGPRPKRTLVFVFATGHLRIPAVTDRGQAMMAWLTTHPEWWSGKDGARRAVAGIVIEHLGARAQPRHRSGDLVDPTVELTYATNPAMQEILKSSWAERRRGKTLIARPRLIHIGEGEPLYEHGIPAIALASVPDYLLVVTKADVVDAALMHEQIRAFARALLMLEEAPTRTLGHIKRASLIKKVVAAVRLLLIAMRSGCFSWVSMLRALLGTRA